MEAKLNSTELDPEKDIKFVNDDLYYTFSGAMKMTKLGDSALRKRSRKSRSGCSSIRPATCSRRRPSMNG